MRKLARVLAGTTVVLLFAAGCGGDDGAADAVPDAAVEVASDEGADPGPADEGPVPDRGPTDEGGGLPDDDGPAPWDPGGNPFDGWFTDPGPQPDEGGPEVCVRDCAGRQCGPDGCGGNCGICGLPKTCDLPTGQCVACKPPAAWGPAAVVDSVLALSDAAEIESFCFDFDGDQRGDSALADQAPALNEAIAALVGGGTFHLLLELEGAKDLVTYAPFLLNALAGFPDPAGGGGFLLDRQTYHPDTCRPRPYYVAKAVLKEGALSAGPSNFVSTIPYQGALATVRFDRIRVSGTVTGQEGGAAIDGGRMTAVITPAELDKAMAGLRATCAVPHPPALCGALPYLETLADGLAPDVDTDGDFQMDATSLCFRFTARATTITGVGCLPACEGKACGPDGCGGTCGDCGEGLACDPGGHCVAACEPPLAWGPTGAVTALEIVADPAVAQASCPDRDDDGDGDNGLGAAAAILNPEIAQALAAGTWAPLVELAGATDLAVGQTFTLHALEGIPTGEAGAWLLDRASYDPVTCEPQVLALPGVIQAGGALAAGPANRTVRLPWKGIVWELPLRDLAVAGTPVAGPDGVAMEAGFLSGLLTRADLETMVAGIEATCAWPEPPGLCQNLALLRDLADNAPYDQDLDYDGTPDALSACARFTLAPATIVGYL